MVGLPHQQLQRMRQEINDGLQRFHCACWTAWKIQDQARTADPAHSAAERRKPSLPHSLGAHEFRKAFNEPVTHRPSSLGCNVTRGDPGPSGGYHEARRPTQLNEFCLNFVLLVGHEPALTHSKPVPLQGFRDGWTGKVCLLSPRARVADRQHGGQYSFGWRRMMGRRASGLRCRAGHLRPRHRLPRRPRPHRALLRRADAIPPSAALAYSAWSFPARYSW